jgi:hypothetical protein
MHVDWRRGTLVNMEGDALATGANATINPPPPFGAPSLKSLLLARIPEQTAIPRGLDCCKSVLTVPPETTLGLSIRTPSFPEGEAE